MSKELEALEKVKYNSSLEVVKYFDILQQALNRLEAIDNASPSEALEELIDMIEYFTRLDYVEPIVRNEIHDKFKDIYWHKLPHLDTIKQALLKAQKPKQYLKWEDLEFKEEEQWLKVKLGDNVYRVDWYIDGLGANVVSLYKYITNDYLVYSVCIKDNSQQFFNDLHLERVEE